MFDRDGIWEMNKAHHRELLDAAATHRMLSAAKRRHPAASGLLNRLLLLVAPLRGELWTARHLNGQGSGF